MSRLNAQPVQVRRDSLISQIADHYVPPSMDIGDPEKYYWPKALARLIKHGATDSTANSWITRFAKHPPFHFTLVGMVRILFGFPTAPALVKNKRTILRQVFERKDSYNAFTAEGTENHISMSRTSGYLFAQAVLESDDTALYPQARKQQVLMRDWILSWADRATRMGTGEWNSSIYGVYNLLGWLNLYDYAKDPEIHRAAASVVDYYTAEFALHFSYGVAGGSEMRGNGAGLTGHTASSYWCWYWFGNRGYWPDFDRSGEYIQTIHAALSTYLPSAAIQDLAAKTAEYKGDYWGQKPDYTIEHPVR